MVNLIHTLDAGSGFSSYIVLLYKEIFGNVVVHVIDDNDIWLNKTKHFLDDNLLTPDILQLNHANLNYYYDLLIYDLNEPKIREQYLYKFINKIAISGRIIIRDLHKVYYKKSVRRALDKNNFKYTPINNNHDNLCWLAKNNRQDDKYYFGIDIGGTYVRGAVISHKGKIIGIKKYKHDRDRDNIFRWIKTYFNF